MHRTAIAALLGAFSLSGAQAAPLIDVYVGAYTWNADLSGDIASDGEDINMERDLGFDGARQTVFYVGLEHPVPVVPNARLRLANLSESATGTLRREYTFGPITYDEEANVRSDLKLNYQDLTLYYTPFDLVFKLDLGLTLRRIDAEMEIRDRDDSANRHKEDVTVTLPMLHLGARGDLPLTGFYATGELNAISYDGNQLTDLRAGIGWRSDFLFGVEAGFSSLQLKLDDVDDLDADISIGGPYIALSLSF